MLRTGYGRYGRVTDVTDGLRTLRTGYGRYGRVTDGYGRLRTLRTRYSMVHVQGTLHVGSRSLYGLTDLYRIRVMGTCTSCGTNSHTLT
jgi:hypothetical protein